MNNRQIYIGVFLVFVIALIAHLGYLPMAVFQSNTVTVTPEDPAIEINGVQYHYKPFDLILAGNTEQASFDAKLCSTNLAYDAHTLISRFNGHESVLRFDLKKIPRYRDGGNCGGARSVLGAVQIILQTSYLDSQSFSHTGKSNLVGSHLIYETYHPRSEPVRTLPGTPGAFKLPEEYLWVNVGDVLYKFQYQATDTGGEYRATDSNGHTQRRGYSSLDYRIAAWVYVPETYFEVASCGDGNCDLTENCKTCEQDCGICVVPDCGNGICSEDENHIACPADCEPAIAFCGDGFCNGVETCLMCAQDCGECQLQYCGNGNCGGDETCVTCDSDCGLCPEVCGNGVCRDGETSQTCPIDCGSPAGNCGDGVCGSGEDCRCEDCSCSQSTMCNPESPYSDGKGCAMIIADDFSEPETDVEPPGEIDPELEGNYWDDYDPEPDDYTLYFILLGIGVFGYLAFIRKH